MARALDLLYICYKNKTQGKQRIWDNVRRYEGHVENMLKTLNPTPGHEQKLGRFFGSLWAMNPGHSTTNEKFA
jgi:hypothetical protein